MKKYSILLSVSLILLATSIKAQNTTPVAEATINYNSLDWFKKGNVFLFTTRDGTGQVLDYVKKKIDNVSDQDGTKTVLIQVDAKTKSILTWIGTPEKLWMDFGTDYTKTLKNIYPDFIFSPKNEAPTKENGMLSIPLQLSVGQQLDDTNFQLLGTIEDKEVKIINTLTQRKIEGREELKTSAGKFDCFKISALSTTTIETKSKIKNLIKPTLEYFWFDVHSGIIKQESRDMRGKLISFAYLTEIKK